jgi:hypothetical protein
MIEKLVILILKSNWSSLIICFLLGAFSTFLTRRLEKHRWPFHPLQTFSYQMSSHKCLYLNNSFDKSISLLSDLRHLLSLIESLMRSYCLFLVNKFLLIIWHTRSTSPESRIIVTDLQRQVLNVMMVTLVMIVKNTLSVLHIFHALITVYALILLMFTAGLIIIMRLPRWN